MPASPGEDVSAQAMPRPDAIAPVAGSFLASEEAGNVSSLLLLPPGAAWIMTLAHGAGAGMRHENMERIARAMAAVGVATFRYQFPYMERGGKGRDPQRVTLATVRSATAEAQSLAPHLPLLAGGHSFGGRMTSLAAGCVPLPDVLGLVLFAFPLHPAGKPSVHRADHLKQIALPVLLLSGTRDRLADRQLLHQVCRPLKSSITLYEMDGADHSYRVPRRGSSRTVSVFAEMASVVAGWAASRSPPHTVCPAT